MANPRGESNLIVWWIRTESNRDNDPRSGADATVTAVLRELKETEIKDKRADYEARADKGAKCGDLKALAAAGEKFAVIYADPPWEFKVYRGKGKQRSAERYYDTSSIEAIKALPVAPLAADDCALFMWAVMPELPGALEVIKAWGFEYKTAGFTWVKQNKSGEGLFTGMGYWTRSNAEICLFATRGSPQRMAKDVSQVILSPVGEHSAKPQEARRRIERLLLGPYLELFARSPADGWVTWGNEINQTVVRVPHAAFRQPGRDWSRTRPAAINGAPGSATPRPAFCHDSTLTPNPASSGASK